MPEIFSRIITILERNLDFRGMRHNVIASNIANQETPGYKAKDLSFKKELESAGRLMNVSLARTHNAHLIGADLPSSAVADVVERKDASHNLDGNTVNQEKEMALMAENNIMYDAGVQLLSRKFRSLREAIKEGK